jgi:hypothetical protein
MSCYEYLLFKRKPYMLFIPVESSSSCCLRRGSGASHIFRGFEAQIWSAAASAVFYAYTRSGIGVLGVAVSRP